MNEQPLDLRRMIRAVWKRWLLVLVVGWAGCVGAYLASSRRPPLYEARSSVLLPPSTVDAQGNQTRNINTQVNIASNGNLLQRAGRAVNPPIGARRMRNLIKVNALTSDILEVRAEARTGRDAALLADAVAKEYVTEATAASSMLSGTAISGLERQVATVEARLQQTKAKIDASTARVNNLPPSSPERLREAAIIDGLRLEEVEAARQLSGLADRIAEARLQDQLNREGTRLLAPAIIPVEPSQPKPLVFTIGGALLGLIGGVVLALIRERRDDRLRNRSEIAQVVAAPVLASLDTPRRLSARVCRTMLERWEPRPSQAWVLRQACERLGILHGASESNLVVVGLPGDTAGPLVAIQLAVFAASAGTETALVVASPHPTAAHLRSACHRGALGGEVRPYLLTSTEPVDSHEEDGWPRTELTISFVVAEPGQLPTLSGGEIATLALSSGFATSDTLALTALSCLDARIPLRGVFLANPDPSDTTTGDLNAASARHGSDVGHIELAPPMLGVFEQSGEVLSPRELASPSDGHDGAGRTEEEEHRDGDDAAPPEVVEAVGGDLPEVLEDPVGDGAGVAKLLDAGGGDGAGVPDALEGPVGNGARKPEELEDLFGKGGGVPDALDDPVGNGAWIPEEVEDHFGKGGGAPDAPGERDGNGAAEADVLDDVGNGAGKAEMSDDAVGDGAGEARLRSGNPPK